MTKSITPHPSRPWWKLFFWINFILTVFVLVIVASAGFTDMGENLSMIVLLIEVLGMFGFAYRKKIASSQFWLFFFTISLLTGLYDLSDLFYPETEPVDFSDTALSISVYIILSVPLYYALYRYSQHSPEIWAPTTPKDF